MLVEHGADPSLRTSSGALGRHVRPGASVGYVPAACTGLPRTVRTGGAGRLARWPPRTVRTGYACQPWAFGTYRARWHPKLRLAGYLLRRGERLRPRSRAGPRVTCGLLVLARLRDGPQPPQPPQPPHPPHNPRNPHTPEQPQPYTQPPQPPQLTQRQQRQQPSKPPRRAGGGGRCRAGRDGWRPWWRAHARQPRAARGARRGARCISPVSPLHLPCISPPRCPT